MVWIIRWYIQSIWCVVGAQRRKRQIWTAPPSPKAGAQHTRFLQACGRKKRESLTFHIRPSPSAPSSLFFPHLPASFPGSRAFNWSVPYVLYVVNIGLIATTTKLIIEHTQTNMKIFPVISAQETLLIPLFPLKISPF